MDPETIAEIVSAVISVVKGMTEASATARWQHEVSGKLDFIIQQNSQILAFLRQLPLLLDEEFEKWFNTEASIQANSLCMDFDNYMKGRHPDIEKIKDLAGPSERLLPNLLQRSPCIYQAANAVALLVIAIHKLTHVDKKQTQGFVDQTITAMTTWAGTNPGMFGKAIIDVQTELTSDMNVLTAEPRGHAVVIYSANVEWNPPGGGGGGHHTNVTVPKGLAILPLGTVRLEITADIVIDQTNFTYSLQNPKSSWFDTLHFDDEEVQNRASATAARLQAELNRAKTATDRLAVLQKHQRALQKMIATLQHWH